MATGGEPHEDLVQQARLGLLQALDRFDPERGVELWTYARWWVRVSVREYVNRNRGIVTIGRPRASVRAWSPLSPREEAMLSPQETESVRRIRAAQTRRGTDLEPVLRSVPEPSAAVEDEIIDRIEQDVRHAALRAALAELDARSRDIVQRRFLNARTETLGGIGRRHGISRERVRQLSERALSQLRRRLERTLSPEARTESQADELPVRAARAGPR